MQRYIKRGTYHGPAGEQSGNAKLTAAKVLAMRRSDLPNGYFARLYRLNAETIRRARVGLSWTHLGDDELAIELQGDDKLSAGLPVDDETIKASQEKLRKLLEEHENAPRCRIHEAALSFDGSCPKCVVEKAYGIGRGK